MHRNNRGSVPLWQLALYIAVLGVISMLLAPLTALWWIVPALGAAVPVALAFVQGREHRNGAAGDAPERVQVTSAPSPDDVAQPGPGEDRALKATVPADAGTAGADRESTLSERELEVLALLAAGKTNTETAQALFISVGTVKSHSANIYRKLEARNRTEAVARARELGLLE